MSLTHTDLQSIRRMRRKGFAVIVWTPDELNGVSPNYVEDRSIELGWQVTECLVGEPDEDEMRPPTEDETLCLAPKEEP